MKEQAQKEEEKRTEKQQINSNMPTISPKKIGS